MCPSAHQPAAVDQFCSVSLFQPYSPFPLAMQPGFHGLVTARLRLSEQGEKTTMSHSYYLKAAVQIASPACRSSPSIPPLAFRWYHSDFNLFVLSVSDSHITSYQPWLLSEQELDSCLQATMLSLLSDMFSNTTAHSPTAALCISHKHLQSCCCFSELSINTVLVIRALTVLARCSHPLS